MSRPGQTTSQDPGIPTPHTGTEILAAVLALAGALLLGVAPSTALIALSLALLAIAFAVRPAWGPPLLAYSLPFYLEPRNLGSMAFSMPELILLAMIAGVSVRLVREVATGRRPGLDTLATPLDGPIALFIAAALISLLASELMRVSLRDLRTLVLEPVAAYYLAVWFIRQKTDLHRLLGGILLGGAAVAAIGLYQYFLTTNVVDVEGSRRILGPYLSPNHAGLYMGRMIPIALALAIFLPGWRRRTVPLLAMLAGAQLLTFSVGAWLGTTAGVLLVLFLWNRRSALAMGAAVLVLLAAALPLSSIERISSHFSLARGTSFIRIQLWEASIHMIQDHPIFGVGMDNFLYQYRGGYLSPEAAAEPNLSHPHNLILNFWLQMGILGVVSVGWLSLTLARLARQSWHSQLDPTERATLAGFAGAMADLVVHGMVDNSYFLVDLAFLFWLLAATVVILWKRHSADPLLPPHGRIE